MKKMREILPASRDETPLTHADEWRKNRLIDQLEVYGHVPIAVGRALFVIEQCESGDDYPKGWSQNPLKISIYSDPDVTGVDEPQELFVHAGKHGLMEVFLRLEGNQRLLRLMPVEARVVEQVEAPGNVAQVETLLALLEQILTGFYSERITNGLRIKHDESLEKLGKVAQIAVRRYVERLRSLPDVWSGYWDDQR